MKYRNFRDWQEAAERRGELLRISGAHWDLEMSTIAEIIAREGKEPKPMVLFDDIPGYPKGYRTLFGLFLSPAAIASGLRLPEEGVDRIGLLKGWREKVKTLRLIPPKLVPSGPVMANKLTGDQIDVLKFPVPRFHELDTARFIGTAVVNIQKDPDGGWVNLGTYRNQVISRDRITFHAVEARHGVIIKDKYHDRGRVMPFAIAMGVDPALWWASTHDLPWGVSEYDYAGGILGEPVEVIEGPYTKLPLPADAEIVIEGECHPGETADEGPFGEWSGYYANQGLVPVPEPLIRVKAVYHRDDPILTCFSPAVPVADGCLRFAVGNSEAIWTKLETLGIPGVSKVWSHELGFGMFNVIAIQQQYAGHAQQVGLTASQLPFPGLGRYTVVVDDDVDPSNLEQVVWAIMTRAPADHAHIHILERCVGKSSDPTIPLSEKMKYQLPPKPLHNTRVVINACRDLEHKQDWLPMAMASPELRTKILDKWGPALSKVMAPR